MPDPKPIVSAYATNLGNAAPDLLITPDGNGRLSLLNKQNWTYSRLEIFGGDAKKLLVIPTLARSSDSFNSGGDGIVVRDERGLLDRPERILTLRCSLPCLIGNRITSIRIKLRLTFHDNSAFITFRKCTDDDGCCKIGSYDLKRNGQDWELPLAELTSILTQAPSLRPYVDLDRTDPKAPSAGPLLELIGGSSWKRYAGSDFKGRRLSLNLLGAGGDCPTIQISEDDSGLGGLMSRTGSLHVGRVDLQTNGPVQSLTQRPSDDWLARRSGKNLIVQGRLNASELWNTAVSDYERALKIVRSPTRLSLLPVFRDDPHSANWRVQWGADYTETTNLVSGKTQSTIGVGDIIWQLQSIQPHAIEQFDQSSDPSQIPSLSGKVYFPFDPDTAQSCVMSPDHADNQAIGLLDALAFRFQLADNKFLQSPQTRIGSLDVTFGGTLPNKAGLIHQEQRYVSSAALLNLAAYADPVGTSSASIPLLRGEMFLPVIQVDPAGQDGLPGSEYVPENYEGAESPNDTAVEQQFQGSAPVVIAINSEGSGTQTSPVSRFWAEIVESNPQLYSQTVSIQLHTFLDAEATGERDSSDLGHQVIVLDSDPFLVAEVRFDGLHRRSGAASSDVIAIWNMNRVDGAGWELYTNAEPFRLVIPPQSLGEEMPKGRELEDKYNASSGSLKPLEFRIGPPAVEVLEGSYTPQDYTEAPWNLRRILGYPGQRDAGASVTQLQYELLYGLSCVATAPMLRLAEIFATLGRIPGRLRPLSNSATISTADPISKAYADYRVKWAGYYGLYRKRVAVLEPRFSGPNYGHAVGVQGASATPEVFTLEAGIQCNFRSSASLYYNATSESNAGKPVDQDEFNVDPKGLRGGSTWGFEAPRIYHATLRNPNSSSAKLVNPYFSALGGSGYQKVSFDRGLTSVYSNTEIGRTFYYSVERMGRIGIYHNLARHVIEYERSVAPGPQFSLSQTAFCGGPVLRKMREYIQILEPKVYLSAGKTPYPECGFAKAIEFKTEIIPVDSSWGANVGNTGWKIPLWRRSVAQAPADHASTKGTGPTSTRLKEKPSDAATGCLPPPYFYSKPEVIFDMAGFDGADVECAITDPEKLFFYTETDENAKPDPHEWVLVEGLDFSLAAIPAQNPGFQSSSVKEIPAHDAAVPIGLSAFTLHLDPGHGTVNMVQGRTAQPLGAVLKSVTFQRPSNIASKPDLQTHIEAATNAVRQSLFAAIRTGDATAQQLVKTELSTILSSNLQSTLSAYINSQKDQLIGPAAQLFSRVQDHFSKWSGAIDADVKDYQEDWNAQWKRIAPALSPSDYRLKLKAIADNEIDALFARIEALPISVSPLGRLCATIDRELSVATGRLNSVVSVFDKILSDEASAADLDVKVLDSQIGQFISDIHSVLYQLRVAIQPAVESWMPGVGLLMHVWEEAVFGAVSKIDSLTGNVALKISDVRSYLKNLKPPTPLDSFKADLEKAANVALKGLNLKISDLDTQVQKHIEAVHQDVRTTADNLIDNFVFPVNPDSLQSAILSLVQQAQAAVATQLQTQLKTLLDTIAKTESSVLSVLTSLLGDASAEIAQALADIIPGSAAEILEAARKKVEDALGRYVESLLTNLPPQLDLKSLPGGNVVDTVLQRAFGAAPHIPNLNFSLPDVGYFYLPGVQAVNLTPLLTQVAGLGAALSPLGSMLPSTAMLDRMLPSDLLKNFNLSDVLPNFAGLKLDSLFSGLKMPNGADKYIKISHGIDQSSKRAWVQADINFSTDTVATLFTIGPLALQLPKATFACQVKLQADASGQIVKQATGSITGDWTLNISGTRLLTMTRTTLSFDEQGQVHFNVSPDRVVLAEALSFIEKIIASYSSPGSGFSIVPSPTGIETRLDLPIPNTSGGTTGITNLTIGFSFGLQFAPSFAITAGFNLGRKKAPFNIMVFILGGAGFVETDITFMPGKQLQCSVTIELAASASLAIAFGPISGYVAIFLGMSVNFQSGAGSDLRLGIFIQVIGEVSILSIVSVYVGLRLEATYENGTFTGRGQFSISIKICWCFTLDVDEHVEFTLGGGGGQHQQLAFNEPPRDLYRPNEIIADTNNPILQSIPRVNYVELATAYINMIS